MNFQSYAFIFVFLPLFLLAYFLCPKQKRFLPLLFSSWVFYGLLEFRALLLLWLIILIAFIVGQILHKTTHRRGWFFLGLGLNLAILFYFKYTTFGLTSLNQLLGTNLSIGQTLLPIGLSFYVFNAIAYLSDVYRGQTSPAQDFWTFATAMSFFASLLNGPLLRYSSLAPQLVAPCSNQTDFSKGALRFMAGFCKKVLIADAFAPLVHQCFSLTSSSSDIWFGAVLYSLQLYFDFSGYSDMAIGVALMLGIRLPENFNYPYCATSLTEFWQRWHMSLSGFLKQYVYIPLGGNRHGEWRTYLHLLLTMLLGGLWHGANWTFVAWGAWNGAFLMLERWLKQRFQRPSPPIWYALPKTFLIVILGRLFFISPDLSTAFSHFAALFGSRGWHLSQNVTLLATPERLILMLVAVILCFPLRLELSRYQGLLLPLFWIAILFVAAREAVPFLYFRF